MKIFRLVVVAAGLLPCATHAADKPLIGPPPAWVKPIELSSVPPKSNDAAVRLLLTDAQVDLQPDQKAVYNHSVFQIQTPEGLAIGNLSFDWRSENGSITVHKLLIRRGDQVIDVLASGQTFTVVRREQNLENAMLDGVLTANIQPEGLQVGDILEFAATSTSTDPNLPGHAEIIAGSWNGIEIGQAHLRVQWPSTMPVRLRSIADLPVLKPVTVGGTTHVELSLTNVQPLNPPKGAPPRYHYGRMIEFTNKASWADLAALMAPLYQKTAVIPAQGPLRDELERIRKLSADPKVRAEAVLALVQDRVRYVALMMGEGNLLPVDAETTWSRRFGDCKAKTSLLLGLLHELGIKAEPVAVSTVVGDGLDERLPMFDLFDHVLVRATVAGKAYWLDGTRTGDKSLDRLQVPYVGWGLPLVAKGAQLVRMVPQPLEAPSETLTIHIDARKGLSIPAPTRIETTLTGDAASSLNSMLANLSGDARERTLRQYWRNEFNFIDVTSVASAFDAQSGEMRLSMQGLARMDWEDGWYQTDRTRVGFRADFTRDPGPDQDAPFAVAYPFYRKNVETILLPPGFTAADTLREKDVEQTVANIEYRRHATFKDDVFTIVKTERSIAPEFPAKEAPAAQAALRKLADQTVYLRKPINYLRTEEEIKATVNSDPTTVEQYLERGYALAQLERYREAVEDFTRALEFKPGDPQILAFRGLANAWAGNIEAAAGDLDAANKLAPNMPVVHLGYARIAMNKREFQDAVKAYTKAKELNPEDSYPLVERAAAYFEQKDYEAALRDSVAVLSTENLPVVALVKMRLLRANVFKRQGKKSEAAAEAVALAQSAPNSHYAQLAVANIYSGLGQKAEALKAYDRAFSIAPDPYVYLNRAQYLPDVSTEERIVDLDKALKLNPEMREALEEKARLQTQAKNYAGAIDTYTKLIALAPEEINLLKLRGHAYARLGNTPLARQDFASARAKSVTAIDFNELCWHQATAGFDLETALADCNRALEKEPDHFAALDSRGFVLLRLGRLDEAIREFDRALAEAPGLPAALYGRAVALSRKGDKARAEADAAAARKAYPDVEKEYADYGLEL
ncbi:MAG TPA: tetratricopeptide repeat protein [Pedomonas sp.]|uniref:tetratricopeptide repeat protein n=1 Tax=Pedomonas sp. TaxID=2976421 RepID=UPI002F418C14